jgi:hypothetical protein
VWAGVCDFCKAFDTVEHCEIWKALDMMGVQKAYIRTLSLLYSGQTGMVITDKKSKTFSLFRGTKQGDPLSPSVFNAVLEMALRNVQEELRSKRYGLQIGSGAEGRLCNLRFADDLMILASSRKQLSAMMQDLVRAARKVGLDLHMGKTKVLCNVPDIDRTSMKALNVDGQDIEILAEDASIMYLGRSLSFGVKGLDQEIQHRINRGWAKFHTYYQELTGAKYPLRDRMRLFEAVVTPTVMYGAATWVMTKEREKLIRTAQRKMLRKVVRVASRRMTSSSDTTSEAEGTESSQTDDEHLDALEIEDWVH